MTGRDLRTKIAKRSRKLGIPLSPEQAERLAAYLEILGRWNRKINLTALAVDPLNEEALDRLVMEPLLATRQILPTDRVILDIGSGGGSPAIPIQIMKLESRVVMVESKVRKSAFLREAIRNLGLTNASVENCRFEELLAKPTLHESVDLVTMRAVKVDSRVLKTSLAFLRGTGRIFLFRASSSPPIAPDMTPGLTPVGREMLIPSTGSGLDILALAIR